MGQKYRFLLPLAFAAVMILGMYAGARMAGQYPAASRSVSRSQDKISHLLGYIQDRYVDTVIYTNLVEAGIAGILESLDPHSVYIPAGEFRQANVSLEGNFDGIGIEFYIVNDTIMVINAITGGPSEVLGIRSGDMIVKIDGRNVAGTGIRNEDVVRQLRGPRGTRVKVSIKRKGGQDLLVFEIKRDRIPFHSVDAAFMSDSVTGYLKVSRFSANTSEEVLEALESLKKAGMKRLIFDLRDNSGGYLDAAIRISDEFLGGDKLIVYTEGKAQPRRDYLARRGGEFEEGRLAVLINESSASASEIVAGALQEWDRAVVVGRRSFGKGLVQEQYVFPDSSAVRLTIARYYTPSGRSIQKAYQYGTDSYYDELTQRFKHGELLHADSTHFNDSLRFRAPSGKMVYGGGGIMPDLFVPLDTSGDSEYLVRLLNNDLVTQFAYDYISKNRSNLLRRHPTLRAYRGGFSPDSLFMKEFMAYAASRGVLPAPGWERSKHRIMLLLKAYMARQLWKNEGFYGVLADSDPVFMKAYRVLAGER